MECLLAFSSQWPRNVILPAAVAPENRGQNPQKSNLRGGGDNLRRIQQKNYIFSWLVKESIFELCKIKYSFFLTLSI